MIEILMVTLGLSANVIKQLKNESKSKGVVINPVSYIKLNPYQTMLTVIFAIVCYVSMTQSGEVNLMYYFGAGWLADSAGEWLGKKTMDKM